jgi:ABC-type phosphate/phosphonate transport system substrate-binding protein
LIKEFGLITKREVHAKFIENIDVLVKNFIEDSRCNSFITYTGYYLKYKNLLRKNSKYFFTFEGSKDFKQYILIANKNSHIKNLKDIENKKFAYFNKSDNNYSQWLDYLILKEFKKPYKEVVVLKKEDRKDGTLVLEVFLKRLILQ